MSKHLWIIGVALLMSSCTRDPSEVYFEDAQLYFDLPGFMLARMADLQHKEQWVRKKVTKDGRTRYIECGDLEWKDELDPFFEANINRPAWRGEFKVDTIQLERVYVVTYKTKNDQIPVKNMVVTIDHDTGQCIQVTVDRRTRNFLYDSDQKLFFTTGEGYMIKGKLIVHMLFSSTYSIESEFIER